MKESDEGRRVTLVLTTDSHVLGMLEPFAVAPPWWSEVASIVHAARVVHGVDVTVLRLLVGRPAHIDRPAMGGEVVYLAQVDVPPPSLRPWTGTLPDDAARATWARPGGPAADLRWATRLLAGQGRSALGPAVQTRSWSLSSIWRLPSAAGDVWLKVVPQAHSQEARVLEMLRGQAVPSVVASDGTGRMLLEHVPGTNQYGARSTSLFEMVALLIGIQARYLSATDGVLAAGVPDWRPDAFTRRVQAVLPSALQRMTTSSRRRLDRLVDGLDRRYLNLEACGLPDTIIHGDLHPGNFRAGAGSLVLLDWVDCAVGHPLLDVAAFLDAVPIRCRPALRRFWTNQWSSRVSEADADRAISLVEPLAALRRAVVYLGFLGSFEPAEHCYFDRDATRWLERAAHLA